MATIKDVAKFAGVSPATVSNILNQKSYVSSETYNKVTEAIKALNYNPNIWASSLKSKKPKMVAVMIPEMNTLYGQIVTGIQQRLEKNDYKCILKITDYNAYQESIMLKDVVKNGIRGILIVPVEVENVEKYQKLIDSGIPVVLLCNELKGLGFSSVVFDNKNIVYQLTDRIICQAVGKKDKISCVLITGDLHYSENRGCKKGFEEALVRHNMSGQCFAIPADKEKAVIGVMDIVNSLKEMPDCFIVTKENYADVLQWVLQKNSTTKIYVLGGELTYSRWDGNEEYISRDTIKLGETAAGIILDNIKSSVYFENKRILIPGIGNDYENLSWEPEQNLTTITLLGVNNVAATKFFLRMLKLFEEEYHIRVECEFLEYSDLYQKINELNQGKTLGYDIVLLDSQWFPSICSDAYLVDMEEFIRRDEDRYLDGFFSIAQKEFIHFNSKGIFMIPILVTMQFLFYRRDLFEDEDLKWHFSKQYGVELRPPQNWTEFDVIAQFFTREMNPESPVLYGTEFETEESIHFSEQFFPRQWSANGSIISKKEVVWDSIENYKAFTNLKNAYLCSRKELERPRRGNKASILDGDVAMAITYASHISNAFHEEKGKVDFSDIVAATVPGKKPLFGGWAMAVSKESRHPYEAYKFIKWITSNRNAVVNSFLGGFVPKNILLSNSGVNNMYPWVKDIQRNFEYAQKRKILHTRQGAMIPPAIVDAILAGTIRKLLTDEWEIEDMIGNLQREFLQLV